MKLTTQFHPVFKIIFGYPPDQFEKCHLNIKKKGHRQELKPYTPRPLTPDRLCGVVVRFPGYKSRGPGSVLGATRFSKK
jgi:hypothetical protein